ncbi:TSEAR-like protein, partial [Mya arenaria]
AGPISLIDEAFPGIGKLPDGVSVVYDVTSHVHALQFLPNTKDVHLSASSIFQKCQYFPEEFSLFFIFKYINVSSHETCLLSITNAEGTLMSVCLSKQKFIFTYNNKRTRFRASVLTINVWHTVGFSVTGGHVAMTTDCLNVRQRRLRRKFPSFLEVEAADIHIGSCPGCRLAFTGLLKDVVMVPGADVVRRACPPRAPRSALLDNKIPQETESMSSYQSVGPDWAGCRWTDVGSLAFDVYSRSIKACVNGVWQHVTTHAPDVPKRRELDYLSVHHDVITPAPSIDVELFHIPGEGLFAVFANSDAGDRGVSGLFKWVDDNFRPYQRLPSVSAQGWRHFTIGANFYLAVANYGNDSSRGTNSTIFKWHRHRKKFREFQTLITYTARDMEFFTIGEEHFLAVANHAIGADQQVDSVIYRWDRKLRRFTSHQTIRTTGAYDWTYFKVDGYHFLAVAQAFNGRSTLIDSVIYVYQKDKFLPFQSIETNGATDWEFFTAGGEAFLAVANAYNYGPQNFRNADTQRTNSSIFRLDVRKRAFVKYQTIETNSAIDWEHFTLGGDHYLLVSNAQNGGGEADRLTTMYRLQGVDRFVPVHQ